MLELFHKWGLPVNASMHGGAIDDLMVYLHWMMLLLFAGWGLFFIYVLFRFRRKRNPKADPVGARSHASSYIEIAVVIAEVILLAGFSIPIWARHVDAFPDPGEGDVTDVRVIAQQFVWNLHYPGPDGKYGRISADLVDPETNPIGLDTDDPAAGDDIWTVNDMQVPVGKPVVARLSSLDVVHSFFLPQMRTKQDVIPGMEVPVWFHPVKETGPDEKWQIACAQLCGVGHYRMAGNFRVVSEDAYQEWYGARHAEMVEEAEADDW